MEPLSLSVMSVRELIAQLAGVEDDLRRTRHPGAATDPEPDVAVLVHREQVIVHELRRRARSRQPRPGPGRGSQPR